MYTKLIENWPRVLTPNGLNQGCSFRPDFRSRGQVISQLNPLTQSDSDTLLHGDRDGMKASRKNHAGKQHRKVVLRFFALFKLWVSCKDSSLEDCRIRNRSLANILGILSVDSPVAWIPHQVQVFTRPVVPHSHFPFQQQRSLNPQGKQLYKD